MTDDHRYQFLPPLLPYEYEALKASIAERGVEVRIVVAEDVNNDEGEIIDGFHRKKACDELGIFCPQEIRQFDSEAEKLELALRLNCRRRQLTRKQKRELIAVYLIRDPEIADNHLADIIGGVSKNTVAEVRNHLESTRQIDKLETLRGKDRKTRPRKYKRIIASTAKEAETALKIINDLPTNCEGKTLDIITAKRCARRARRRRERENVDATAITLAQEDIGLYHCRFQELEAVAGIKAGSVNLILTDVPYGKHFLDQIAELGEFAKRVLIGNGLLVTYAGVMYLDRLIAELSRHLTYKWMGVSTWTGDANSLKCVNVTNRWRPVMIFSKGDWKDRRYWIDVVHGKGKQKQWHPWQQPLDEIATWLQAFSAPGDLVVDPCSGSFTTGIACLRHNRRFIGCDEEAWCVNAARRRLQAEQVGSEGQRDQSEQCAYGKVRPTEQ